MIKDSLNRTRVVQLIVLVVTGYAAVAIPGSSVLGADLMPLRARAQSGGMLIFDLDALISRADRGDGGARVLLADFYYAGKNGVTANRAEAYKWAFVAVSGGYRDAKYVLSEFDSIMTVAERERGKTLAVEYMARSPRAARPAK